MIQLSPGTSIWVIQEPISFCKRLKGLLAYCRDILAIEPMDGAYFVFRNRGCTQIRVIFYDGDGFWMCEKFFSKGKIHYWANGEGLLSPVTARELAVLLWRGNPRGAAFPEFWKKVS